MRSIKQAFEQAIAEAVKDSKHYYKDVRIAKAALKGHDFKTVIRIIENAAK